jgi:hypothetical protein
MHEGRIAGILDRAAVSEAAILHLATGQQPEASLAGLAAAEVV